MAITQTPLIDDLILHARAYSVLIGFNCEGEDVMDGEQLHRVLCSRMMTADIPLSIVTDCIEWLLKGDYIIRLPNGFKRTRGGELVSNSHYELVYGEEGK